MRTTLTLDDDVAVQLNRLRAEKRITLKEAVNTILRRGLAAPEKPSAAKKRFRTEGLSAGEILVPNFDNIGEVLAELEGEDYK